jgi:beta-glucosidase
MRALLAEGIDLRGYFHWTLTDNFEWNEGWHLRFGLFELDPVTQMRTPRPSAQVYARLIRESMGKGEMAGPVPSETGSAQENVAQHDRTDTGSELSSGIAAENEGSFGK